MNITIASVHECIWTGFIIIFKYMVGIDNTVILYFVLFNGVYVHMVSRIGHNNNTL